MALIDSIRPLEPLLRRYLGGWQQTALSISSVEKYQAMGFSAIGPSISLPRKGDTLFILGSGPTINDITDEEWELIGDNCSLAFNKFIAHKFVPDLYFIQGNRLPKHGQEFMACYEQRVKDYENVHWFARGDLVNNFRFHQAPACARVMELNPDRLFFAPELFVSSRATINPVRVLNFLIDKGVVEFGSMPRILLKVGATVPLLHLLAACLGYRKVVLCGIDMFDNTHFFDAQYGAEVYSRFEAGEAKTGPHPHANKSIREFSIERVIVDQARELYRRWQVETFCMSSRSLLHPAIPLYNPQRRSVVQGANFARKPDRPLRIAMLTPSFLPTLGGMEIQLDGLATRLAARGHDVTVFAPRTRPPLKRQAGYRLVEFAPRVMEKPFLASPRRAPLGFLSTSLPKVFRGCHREAPFDVISAHSAYLTSNLASALRELYDVPVVTRCHGMDINRFPDLDYGWRLDVAKDRIITAALKSSDRCVAISSDVVKELSEIVAGDRIVNIHNGVDTDVFRPGRSRVLRERFNLPENAVIGLTVGRNVPVKRFDLAVEAVALLGPMHPDFHLVILGTGCEPLQALAEQLGVQNKVHILGTTARENLPDIYRSADLFVFPSVMETFGVVTAEAMASGLPVVGFDAPGTRDLVVDGETGILLREVSAAAISGALRSVLSSPERRKRMSEKARQRSLDCFSWDRTTDAYERLYRELAIEPYTACLPAYPGVEAEVEAFDRDDTNFHRHPHYFVQAGLARLRLIARDLAKAATRKA